MLLFFVSDNSKKMTKKKKKKRDNTHVLVTKYNRINDLAKLFKMTVNKISKSLKLLKHKKRIYMKHDGIWFQFQSMNEVIIPSEKVKEFASSMKKEVELIDETMMLELNTPEQPQAILVVALLGHFNHGKTTLLDALKENSNIVDEEAHSITQVNSVEVLCCIIQVLCCLFLFVY